MLTTIIFSTLLLAMILHADAAAPANCKDKTPYLPIKDADDTIYYVCYDKISRPQLKNCPSTTEFNDSTMSCTPKFTKPGAPKASDCTKDGDLFDDPTTNTDQKCDFKLTCTGNPGQLTISATGTSCGTDKMFNSITKACVPDADWYCGKDGPDCDIPRYQDTRIFDKYNCNSYYECSGDIRVKSSCASGQVFDPSTGACSSTAACKVLASPPTYPAIKDICKGNNQKFVADPNYCMGYYYCVDEKTPYWSNCGTKYFNNGFCTSTRPNTCKCEDIKWLTPPQKVLVPHTENNKFYVCEQDKAAVERTCPSGTNFNQDIKSCSK